MKKRENIVKIKRGPIRLNNVISIKTKCNIQDWHLAAAELRNSVIKNGLYGTGPIVYQISKADPTTNEAEFTFCLPVNMPVEMPEDAPYIFTSQWEFEDGLMLRHADMDEDLEDSYELLRLCAEAQQFVLLEPFYNIYLDVYGSGIIDIYAPIVKGEYHD